MERRKFIKSSSLLGLVLPSLGPDTSHFFRRHASFDKLTELAGFGMNEITIDQLQQKMKEGLMSSRAITEYYLNRIKDIDKSGPSLNAIIELNPDALKIAVNMDEERQSGKVRSLLHGIPVLVKDNIDTADQMMTTAGSLALEGHHAAKDAFIISLLRASGAVLLGKTNLSEWANYRSTRSTSGWSSRGGQTKSPYVLNRNPSGSSAGTGTAVSANLCVVGIGTETDGSIVSPSSVNGLVGIKPTVGLLSRSGIIPISKSQDTAGPMARNVKDAAILLGILAGVDEHDAATSQSAGKGHKNYTQYLNSTGLKGKRIGIEKSLLKGNEAVDQVFKDAMKVLKDQGAQLVEIELLKEINLLSKYEGTVLSFEFKDGLNTYLAAANARVKTLVGLIEFNHFEAARTMPFFKQEIFIEAEARGDLKSKEYLDAVTALRTGSMKAIDSILTANNLHAISAPTNGIACCIDLVNGDYDTGYDFSTPAAVSGYPHITVPMGFVHGLPIGISFMGTAWSEPQLIEIAFSYEQASGMRKAPAFLTELA